MTAPAMATPVEPVLQIVPVLDPGGAEWMAVHLAEDLHRRGIPAGVVALFDREGSPLEKRLRESGVPVWTLGKRKGLDPRVIVRLRKLLQLLRPKVLHTHLSVLRYVVPALMGQANLRLVHTLHRSAERDAEFGLGWLQKLLFQKFVRPVAVADSVAHSCGSVYGMHCVPVVPNGIPVGSYARCDGPRSALRRELGIEDQAFVFCSVARLQEVKNHRGLLQAFAATNGPEQTHLLLAGDGGLRGELEKLARDLQILQRTHFLGARSDVPHVLGASDAFVLASHSEGNPLSVMEAMAAGLPVAATAVGGIPELVEHETHGLLVKQGSMGDLAKAMQTLAASPELCRRLGENARTRAMERFDTRAMTNSYLPLYGCPDLHNG